MTRSVTVHIVEHMSGSSRAYKYVAHVLWLHYSPARCEIGEWACCCGWVVSECRAAGGLGINAALGRLGLPEVEFRLRPTTRFAMIRATNEGPLPWMLLQWYLVS